MGKARHQNTNNFHLFFVISVKLSMKYQMELFPRFLCTEAGRCILYALHLQRFQSYYLEAMNHHDCRRVSEKEKHSFLGTNISFPKNKSNNYPQFMPLPITTNNSTYLLLVLDTTTASRISVMVNKISSTNY